HACPSQSLGQPRSKQAETSKRRPPSQISRLAMPTDDQPGPDGRASARGLNAVRDRFGSPLPVPWPESGREDRTFAAVTCTAVWLQLPAKTAVRMPVFPV